MWCTHCVEDQQVVWGPDHDYIACSGCGKLFEFPVSKSHRMLRKPKKFQGLHGRTVKLEKLSDVDILGVDRYLRNAKKKCLRKIIWEEMHKFYHKVEAAKNVVAVFAAIEAGQVRLVNGSEAQEPATLTVATTISRKEKKHKHPIDNMSSTCTKSCHRELKRKAFSSKINYEVLKCLYKNNTRNERAAFETGDR